MSVGSPDWQRGTATTQRPTFYAHAFTTTSLVLQATGNGIVLWNVDVVAQEANTASIIVAIGSGMYVFCSSQNAADGHWETARGYYVPDGDEVNCFVQGSITLGTFVSLLYDQL